MCGLGTPKPKMYHLELAASTLGWAERLRRDEHEFKMAACVKADELAALRLKPVPRVICKALDLYHLLQIRPQLLDWSYEGQSTKEFKDRFAQSWANQKFQVGTHECIVWWLCEAKV